ncbi:hypothetical protein C6495_18985 [Candidatus Poribacteria bacterium]|nr:MAG: hypothetical protein C6495_18985 [Candidatus Poribacteria bacterium]
MPQFFPWNDAPSVAVRCRAHLPVSDYLDNSISKTVQTFFEKIIQTLPKVNPVAAVCKLRLSGGTMEFASVLIIIA